MRNIAGIAQTDAQKSSDMFAKCQYLDELTGGKGVTFATGTPVSNSMVELYTIMRYLQYYNGFLPFRGKRYSFKLRMTDDNRIVIAGGDAGAEFFAVGGPCRKQNLRLWWRNPRKSKRKWCRN